MSGLRQATCIVSQIAEKLAICLILILMIVSCTPAQYGFVYDGKRRAFDTPEEGYAWQVSQRQKTLNRIEPLASPLAGSASIILPTRDLIEQGVHAEHGVEWTPEWILRNTRDIITPPPDYMANIYEDNFLIIAQAIERRNIFARLEIVRSDTADHLALPATTFVVWMETRPPEAYFLRAVAPGDARWTDMEIDQDRVSSALTSVRAHLKPVEAFVRRNAAADRP